MALTFTIEAEDYLALLTGIGSNDVQVPQRLFTKADFPTLPEAYINKPVPFPYGSLVAADTMSATMPPLWNPTYAYGAYLGPDQQNYIAGWGNQVSDAAVPTNVTMQAVAGGTWAPDAYSEYYGCHVTAVDADGHESDPEPFRESRHFDPYRGMFLLNEQPTCQVDGTNAIRVSWTASANAVKYRVYIATYYFGMRPIGYVEVNAPTVTVDIANRSDLTGITQYNTWEYAISAVCGDGETALAPFARSNGGCSQTARPIRLEWLAVTGATGYRIYKRAMFGTWTWRFDVGLVTEWVDDLTNATAVELTAPPPPHGQVAAIPVGTMKDKNGTDWYAFCVAGCAIKSFVRLYQNGAVLDPGHYGADFAVPGKTNYGLFFDNVYQDINGHRYTLFFALGPLGLQGAGGDGTAQNPDHPITCDIEGIESTGNGTGTLLTNIFDQYKHFMRNLVLGKYQTGNWATSGPTWHDDPNDVPVIDDASFDACKAIAEYYVPGGYTGAFIVGREGTDFAQNSVREWLARLNLSADCYCGFSRKSQFVVRMVDERTASLTGLHHYQPSQGGGIDKDSFSWEDRADEMENPITVQGVYDWLLGTWGTSLVYEDDEAKPTTPDGEAEDKPTELPCYCTRNYGQLARIGAHRLARHKMPPRYVRWTSDLMGLNDDLGSQVWVTHFDGPGVAGYVKQPMFVVSHELDTKPLSVAFLAMDLGYTSLRSAKLKQTVGAVGLTATGTVA